MNTGKDLADRGRGLFLYSNLTLVGDSVAIMEGCGIGVSAVIVAVLHGGYPQFLAQMLTVVAVTTLDGHHCDVRLMPAMLVVLVVAVTISLIVIAMTIFVVVLHLRLGSLLLERLVLLGTSVHCAAGDEGHHDEQHPNFLRLHSFSFCERWGSFGLVGCLSISLSIVQS